MIDTEEIYKDSRGHWRNKKSELIVWCNPGWVTFRKDEIVWLLSILYDLRNGWYVPEPEGGYVELPINKRQIRATAGAYFTRLVELSAEIDWRLERVFRGDKDFFDRDLLENHYCDGDSVEKISHTARLSMDEVERRIERVLSYISWDRKERSYEEYCRHWYPGYNEKVGDARRKLPYQFYFRH